MVFNPFMTAPSEAEAARAADAEPDRPREEPVSRGADDGWMAAWGASADDGGTEADPAFRVGASESDDGEADGFPTDSDVSEAWWGDGDAPDDEEAAPTASDVSEARWDGDGGTEADPAFRVEVPEAWWGDGGEPDDGEAAPTVSDASASDDGEADPSPTVSDEADSWWDDDDEDEDEDEDEDWWRSDDAETGREGPSERSRIAPVADFDWTHGDDVEEEADDATPPRPARRVPAGPLLTALAVLLAVSLIAAAVWAGVDAQARRRAERERAEACAAWSEAVDAWSAARTAADALEVDAGDAPPSDCPADAASRVSGVKARTRRLEARTADALDARVRAVRDRIAEAKAAYPDADAGVLDGLAARDVADADGLARLEEETDAAVEAAKSAQEAKDRERAEAEAQAQAQAQAEAQAQARSRARAGSGSGSSTAPRRSAPTTPATPAAPSTPAAPAAPGSSDVDL